MIEENRIVKIASLITAEVIKQILPVIVEMENKPSISFQEALKRTDISNNNHSV
ncbi:hypothetical protein [Anaerosinus gibii]|uniref:Uncharacterized protein n=1 Tax=Selenobaculum gibii TaxID=3054208 RepID=A0A9Y2EV77_9FIRM|nr:hypothetical protein [Selenobaculum gbiensis]WIW70639.1 hypothetical protein P3F81_12245 [Selenobaculum gbiensis]